MVFVVIFCVVVGMALGCHGLAVAFVCLCAFLAFALICKIATGMNGYMESLDISYNLPAVPIAVWIAIGIVIIGIIYGWLIYDLIKQKRDDK